MKKLLHAMRKTGTLVVLVLLLSITQTKAQLVVSAPPAGPNYTALVQSFFVGQGVTVSNVSYTGGAQAIGSFANTGTNLSLAGGIIITTGNRNLAIGPNNQAGAGSNLNRPGLPELDAQAGATTFDGAVLQFDFVAQSASVSFQYIWASEEYPEYVNAGYNDAFSFFISGPGFGGPTNIALVPNTTTPITIDNVNSNSYSQYYVNNAGGQYIQYDGFTTTMTATATVQPCQTYTLRICIADAGDHIYDSAVFLGQNSLSSNTVTVSSSSGYNGSSNAAYEGCLPGYLNFSIPQAQNTPFTFNYVIGGTAQNGVDYQNIATSVTIPAGQTTAQVVINAIADNLTEGQETVDITVNNMCSVSTTSVYINDVAPLTVNAGPDQLQCGTPTAATLTASASGGLTPYTYSWSNGTTNVGNTASITNTPAGTTTYTVTATGACPGQTATDQVIVTVNPIPTTAFTLSSATVCNGQAMSTTYTGNANTGATYNWSVNNGATITGSGQSVGITYPGPGTYTVSLSVIQGGCTSTTTTTANFTVYPQPNSPFSAPTTLCTGVNGSLNFTGTVIPGATYTWNFNGGTVVSGSGSGPYSVNWATAGTKTVTLTVAANGCTSTSTASINVIQTPTSTFTATSPVCTGQNSSVTYTGAVIPGATYTWAFDGGTVASGSGAGPYQINWATAGTKNITLTVSANGCTSSTTTIPVVVNAIPVAAFASSANPVCNGQALTVSATPVTGATYAWSVNNSATITGSGVGPVTVNYPGVGTYTVTLAVTANGCTSSNTTSTITVNPQPTANFTAASPLCTGVNGTITYNGTPIPGATYTWNFNGGTIASGSGMGPYQVNWATAGTKTVTLTVAANGCTATQTASVIVNQMPTSNFSANAAQYCAGGNATITYNGTQIPGATYTWNFAGGTVASGSGVGPYSVNWSTAGVKNITLTVTSNGCTSTVSTVPVTIYQVPTSTFTASAATVCAGQPLTATYSGNASTNATYTWGANNSATITGSGQGPVSLNYPSAGSYNITLTVAENGCSSTSTTVPVTVNPQPTATFTATSPLCAGNNGTVTYTGTQIPGATYTWNFAGGTVVSGSGAGPYSISWATAGTKNVTLTVAAAGCTASSNVNVVVNPMPSSAFSVSASQFCAGANATITYNAVPVTGATYTWNFNGGTVVSGSGLGPYSVNWSTAGTKTITLTVSANGCTSTVTSQTITIYQVPTSTFTLSSNSVCDGSPVNITYGGNASPSATYTWTASNNGSISNTPSLHLVYPTTGTYNIGLTVTENGCSSSTTTVTVTVKPMPTSNFSVSASQFCAGANGTVTYNGTQINGATYSWNFNGGTVVSGTGAGPYSINWSTPGTKTLTLTVTAAGCTSSVSTQTITIYQVPTSTFTTSANSVCDGSPINITYGGNASPNATYNWVVNNGGSVGTNPLRLVYPAPGSYNIALTVSENGCSSTTSTIPVTVNPIPSSAFSVSNTQFCAGANASISYNGTPINGASYSWNFNGGTVVSGSGLGPYSINWTTPGVKTITLTVSANGCTSSVTSVPVTIYQVPTSTFTVSSNSVCDGSPVNITYGGNASPNATYNWTATNNGSISANPTLHLVYPTTGNYTIGLTVSENGCSSTATTVPVTVKPMPTSNFSVSASQFCAGANATVTYNGTPVTGATYSWNFNGGTIVSGSGMGPYQIAWNTPGSKTITLSVSAAGCTSPVSSQTITIYQVPTSTFTTSANSVCDGSPINITYGGNASPNATYNWVVNNGGSISTAPLHLVYPAPGSYNIALTVSENGCSSTTSTIPVTVNPIPSSSFSVSNTQFCAGANATVSYNAVPVPGATYTWNFNGGTVVSGSGLGPYSINWSTAGTKTITLSVSANGCTSTVTSVPVTIYQVPTSTFITSATSVCDGSPIDITYNGNASPNATYNWVVNNGGSIGNNPLHLVYPAPGNYNIALTVSENGCSSTTNTVPVTVKPMPTSPFTISNIQFCAGANATITYIGTPVTGASYTWNFNGGTVVSGSGMGPYQINWATAGTKTVSLVVSANGCTSTLSSLPVTIYQVPTSTFSVSSNSVCDGQPVNITYGGNASPNATYNWVVNNGGSISSAPLQLLYPAAGSYNISLTVSENGCSSNSTTLPVTVKPQPTATFTAPTPVCTGQPEVITYTGAQIVGASYTWGFNGATVASGSNAGPYTLSWATPGTKNVTLTVNAAGCTASSSNAVVVNQMPTSTFSVSNTQFCAGGNATVTFNGVQVQGANYSWNFNGGNIVAGSGMGPYTINWDTAGTKQITLTVSASGCTSSTTTIPVTIYQVPTSSFSTSAASICNGQPLNITYNGNASPNATYNWVVNNGGSIGNSPLHLVYPGAGNYNITLNVSENGCSSTASTVPVTVYTVPTANFTVQGPICEGASVNVLYTGNANLNNAQFTWGWDSGTASNTVNQDYSVQYANAGNYNLTLHVAENGCGSIDVSHPLVVNAIPTSTFIATSPVCINEGSVVTYTGSAPQSATYAWSFDSGSVVSGQNQGPYTIDWTTPGTKSLKLIVTHNGCVSPQTIVPVNVNDRPTAAFTIADTSICMGQPVTITYNGTGSPNATYNWTASGGATVSHISGNTYQMGYPSAGNYSITLSVTENGCASATPVTAQVAVFDMPTSAFVSSGSPMCDGSPLYLTYNGNASQNANFIWNINGGASIGNVNPMGYPVNYPGAGTYNISLTVSENGCTSTQSSTSVIVYQTPTSAFVSSGSPVCNGHQVDFFYNGNASPNATYNWEVTGGASIIPTGVDTFNLAYTGAGTYVVKLTVMEDGCSSTMSSDTVVVFDVPVSTFVAVQNPVCDGQPVILNYGGQQIPGAVYTWTTPDSVYIEEYGLSSYEVIYPGAGTFDISLKVTANGCPSDTTSVPVIVNANPNAPFTASATVCAGANGNIIYTGPQDPSYSYNWNFDGGSVVSGNNEGPYQVTWATDGIKDVTLIVTNGNGCSSDTASIPVTVYPIPSSSFTASSGLCTDLNGSVYYTGAPTPGAQYTWGFDGANIVSGQFVGPYSLNWNTPGTKLVTLEVSANGCTSPVTTHSVVVNPTPTATFMALDSAVCEGGPITLVYNGNASPSANFNWYTTGGATVSGTGNGPFTVNYPAPGTYYITLTVDENGCTSPNSATVPVTVMPNPNAYFTVPVGECFGNNSYNFLAQGQFTFQADIAWNFGQNANIPTSNVINPSNISFNNVGAQTVSLTVTDNGCVSTFTNMVQVYPDPVIDFVSNVMRGCMPLEVQFTDNSGYGGLATYMWNFGDGDTSSLQNPMHIYDEAGSYSVSLTITFSSACGGSITQNGLITVYPQPIAGFSVTPEQTDMFDPFVTVINEGSGATACFYTMGDGDTLMNTLGGTHEYANAGVYTITQYVSNSYGCSDTIQKVVRIDGQFTIYIPNAFSPNNDGINDGFGAKGTMVNNYTMYIFDRWGELIYTSHSINDLWDGSDPSGKRSQVDVYVYKIVYDEPGGDQKQVVGTVALID